jgi:hypothetical protein
LRRFSYSRDVIAVGGVPNPPHKASTSPRAGWNPGLRTSSWSGTKSSKPSSSSGESRANLRVFHVSQFMARHRAQ